jgi:hypothetical protein
MVHIVRRSSSQRLRQLHPPHVATAGAGATGEDAGGEAKSGGRWRRRRLGMCRIDGRWD